MAKLSHCLDCDAPLRPQNGPGPRRKFCDQCRIERLKAARRVTNRVAPRALSPVPPPSTVQDIVNRPAGECERVVRETLTESGQHETVDGILAIILAREIDDSSTTAPQKASLAKQVQNLVKSALKDVPPPHDFVDDMTERRNKRVSGDV